jgi:hypothetical protein
LRRLLRRVVASRLLLDAMEPLRAAPRLACSERMRAMPGPNFLEVHRRSVRPKRLRLR